MKKVTIKVNEHPIDFYVMDFYVTARNPHPSLPNVLIMMTPKEKAIALANHEEGEKIRKQLLQRAYNKARQEWTWNKLRLCLPPTTNS